jgi:hypothetical protein
LPAGPPNALAASDFAPPSLPRSPPSSPWPWACLGYSGGGGSAGHRRGGHDRASDGYVYGLDARSTAMVAKEGFRVGAGQISQGVAGVGAVLTPLPGARHHKGRTARGHVGQPAMTQTVPKFRSCLCRRGQRGQNTSGRSAGFFLTAIKKRYRIGRPQSICIGPLEMC